MLIDYDTIKFFADEDLYHNIEGNAKSVQFMRQLWQELTKSPIDIADPRYNKQVRNISKSVLRYYENSEKPEYLRRVFREMEILSQEHQTNTGFVDINGYTWMILPHEENKPFLWVIKNPQNTLGKIETDIKQSWIAIPDEHGIDEKFIVNQGNYLSVVYELFSPEKSRADYIFVKAIVSTFLLLHNQWEIGK